MNLTQHRHCHKKRECQIVTACIFIIVIVTAFIPRFSIIPAKGFSYELVENGLIGPCGRDEFNGTRLTAIRSFDLKDQNLLINAGDKIVLLNHRTLDLITVMDEVTFPNGSKQHVTELGQLERIRFDVDGTFYVTSSFPTNNSDFGNWIVYHVTLDGHVLHTINLTALGITSPIEILPRWPYLIIEDFGFSGPSMVNSSIKYSITRLVYLQLNESPLQLHEYVINIPSNITIRFNEAKKTLSEDNITILIKFNSITRTSLTPTGFGVLFNSALIDEISQTILHSSYFIQLYNGTTPEKSSVLPNANDISDSFQMTAEYQVKEVTVPLKVPFNLYSVLFFDLYGTDKAIMSYLGIPYVLTLQPTSDLPLIGRVDMIAGKEVGEKILLHQIKVEKESGRIFMGDPQKTHCIYTMIITDLTPEEDFAAIYNQPQNNNDKLLQLIFLVIIILLLPLDFAVNHPIETAMVIILTVSSFVTLRHPKIRKKLRFTDHSRDNNFEFGDLPSTELPSSSLEQSLNLANGSSTGKSDDEF